MNLTFSILQLTLQRFCLKQPIWFNIWHVIDCCHVFNKMITTRQFALIMWLVKPMTAIHSCGLWCVWFILRGSLKQKLFFLPFHFFFFLLAQVKPVDCKRFCMLPQENLIDQFKQSFKLQPNTILILIGKEGCPYLII